MKKLLVFALLLAAPAILAQGKKAEQKTQEIRAAGARHRCELYWPCPGNERVEGPSHRTDNEE